MSDPVIVKFIVEGRKSLSELAEDAMMYPKSDPFEHGVQTGKYQGIRFALELLESILRETADKEANS